MFLPGSLTALSEDADRSKDARALERCADRVLQASDFCGRNLMGIDFTSADLKLIKFENAVPKGTSFVGVKLGGASFVGVRLINVSLKEADLRGAVFDGATM